MHSFSPTSHWTHCRTSTISRCSRSLKLLCNALYDAILPDYHGPEARFTYNNRLARPQKRHDVKDTTLQTRFLEPAACHEARRSKRGGAISGFTHCGADALNRMVRLKPVSQAHRCGHRVRSNSTFPLVLARRLGTIVRFFSFDGEVSGLLHVVSVCGEPVRGCALCPSKHTATRYAQYCLNSNPRQRGISIVHMSSCLCGISLQSQNNTNTNYSRCGACRSVPINSKATSTRHSINSIFGIGKD
jgi:hypothetical protein